jgi:hypothetical protein
VGRGRLHDLNPEAGALLVYVVPCERVELVDAIPVCSRTRSGSRHRRSCRLWIDLSQAQLERLDAANGELGAQALVKAVALRLADEASAIQSERRRAAFAGDF